MDDRKKLIGELEERSRKNKALESEAFRALGDYIFNMGKENISDKDALSLIDDMASLKAETTSNAKKRERIKEVVRRLEEIRTILRSVENDLTRIEAENGPIFEKVGSYAYENSLDFSTDDPRIAGAFRDITSLTDEIRNADTEIADLKADSQKKSFFNRLVHGGKAMFLHSSRVVKARNLAKSRRTLGKLLLETRDPAIMNCSELGDDRGPYEANALSAKKLESKARVLHQEEAALEEELLRLGVEKRYQKRLKDLEIQDAKIAERFCDLAVALGSSAFEKLPAGVEKDDRISEILTEIEGLRRRILENDNEVSRLEAAVEFDLITGQIYDLKNKLETEQEEIRNRLKKVENLKTSIMELEKEKNRFDKLRR